jgi:5-methylthioadenosine/S-adenosylhomocysteine deaminase
MGARGIVFHEVFGPDPAQCDAAIAALDTILQTLQSETTDRVSLGVSPHAPYTVSDALFRASAQLAARHQLPMTVHVAEGRAEHDLVATGTGVFADAWRRRGIAVVPRARSPIQLLADTGVLDRQPVLIHAVHADAHDRALIRDTGSHVAHCPASNAKLGHGIAPAVEFMEQGTIVGLGTDSVASSNRMDLLDEARLAVLQQRARVARPDVMSASQALRCATLGGARALGLETRVGTLEVGKAADLVAFAIDDVADAPVFCPEDALVFARGGRRARLTMVAGRELVRDGTLQGDMRDDLATLREAATELSRIGDSPAADP